MVSFRFIIYALVFLNHSSLPSTSLINLFVIRSNYISKMARSLSVWHLILYRNCIIIPTNVQVAHWSGGGCLQKQSSLLVIRPIWLLPNWHFRLSMVNYLLNMIDKSIAHQTRVALNSNYFSSTPRISGGWRSSYWSQSLRQNCPEVQRIRGIGHGHNMRRRGARHRLANSIKV